MSRATSLYEKLTLLLNFESDSPFINRFLKEFLLPILKDTINYNISDKTTEYCTQRKSFESIYVENEIERRISVCFDIYNSKKNNSLNMRAENSHFSIYFLLPKSLFAFDDKLGNVLVLAIHFGGEKYLNDEQHMLDESFRIVLGNLDAKLSEIEKYYGQFEIDEEEVLNYSQDNNSRCDLSPEQILNLLIQKDFQALLNSIQIERHDENNMKRR